MASLARGATGPSGNAANGHAQRQSDITARGLRAGSERACVRAVDGARQRCQRTFSLILEAGCGPPVPQGNPCQPVCHEMRAGNAAKTPLGGRTRGQRLAIGTDGVVCPCRHRLSHPILVARQSPSLPIRQAGAPASGRAGSLVVFRRAPVDSCRLWLVAFLFRPASRERRKCRYAEIHLAAGLQTWSGQGAYVWCEVGSKISSSSIPLCPLYSVVSVVIFRSSLQTSTMGLLPVEYDGAYSTT